MDYAKRLLIFLIPMILLTQFPPSPVLAINIYLLNTPIEKIKKIEWKPFLIGALSSVIIHTAGHIIAMEYYNASYKVEKIFLHEEYNDVTPHETRRIARAGFFAQHLATTLLLSFDKTKEMDFTRGFTTMTFLETLFYPLYNGNGDYQTIDKNDGDPDRDYLLFNIIGFANFIRIEW